jgi:creatinine amidohydrolase/Fe(II)-dependent formamide hydrolase-like protein
MGVGSKRGIYVTRRCRKNGRRFVEMVCHVGNYQLAANIAREFNQRDDSHVYAFSWRRTAEQAESYWSDTSQDFDVAGFFRNLDMACKPIEQLA